MPNITTYFKALADETRLRLLHVLYRHELNVNELVFILEMGQSRISRHLKILAAAGLLTWRRDGLWVFYTVPTEGTGRLFLDATIPFIAADPAFHNDMLMAASLLEERAGKTRQFFNAIAEDWDALSREVLGDFDLAKAVLTRMPQCRVAADLGCGTGAVLHALLEKAEAVIGVDDSPRMLELARRRFAADPDRISLRIGDLLHLPLRDHEADCITLSMVLHHVPSPVEALAEIRRVLTPGGVLVLTDFNRHEDEHMRLHYGDRWLGFDIETLTAHFLRAGFHIQHAQLIPVERSLALHIIQAIPVAGELAQNQ